MSTEATYTILGTDGQQYGPVTLEQLKAWAGEGRVAADTQVCRSDVNAWHPASHYTELGLGTAVATVPAAPSAAPASQPELTALPATAELEELDKRIRNGASWFYWIAGLSVVNSVAAMFGSNVGFVLGLSITQIIDALVQGAGGAARAVALVIDLLAAGVFVLFGVFAYKRHNWAFIVGLVLYGLDTILTALAQVWFSLAFHAWALLSLGIGLKANLRHRQLSRGGA